MPSHYNYWKGLACLGLLLCAQMRVSATTYTLNTGGNDSVNWSDPTSWQPNGVPGANDDVVINGVASTYLNTVGDITVKSFTVSRLAYIFGPGTLTVTENLDVRYPMFWQMRLVIAAGANASLTDENFSTPYTGITFYNDLIVNGNLVMEARSFSGMKVIINGTLTQKEGNLNAFVLINPGGVLQINSPDLPVSIGRVVNKGTLNWQAGQLKSVNGPIINEGLWNISIEDETLSFEGFFQDSLVYNSGTIELAPNVVRFALTKRIVNTGTINMNGATKLSLLALDHYGSINGPTGATLEIIGNYFDTGTTINSGSIINVPRLETSNSSTLTLNNGCNIAAVQDFMLRTGIVNLNMALPPAADYTIQATVMTNIDQNFTGTFLLEGGSINGICNVSFDTPNLTASSGYFNGYVAVTLSANTILTIQSLGVSNLINNGTIACVQKGGLIATSAPGIFNNGTWNITADSVIVLGYSNAAVPEVTVHNNGVLNLSSSLSTFMATMENNGVINMSANHKLVISGDFAQKNALIGQSGSLLNLNYSFTGSIFYNGSQTTGLSELSVAYGKTTFQQGAILNNISNFIVDEGTLETSVVLPPAAQYLFKNSLIRLNTTFQPATVLELEDTDIEGSGNLRIGNAMNWNGGTMDVPVNIFENAQLSVQERNKRPVISAPFTNSGNTTLAGGILEINTGFFKNLGSWNVVSEEDVIMDGFTAFTNEGIFSICGNQPIQMVFNVPFINKSTGTFKGEGSYTFNAGFTNEGAVAPGCSPGILSIEDNLIAPSMVEIEVEGNNSGEYDQLLVNGNMSAGAVLNILVPDGISLNGSIKVIQTTGSFTGTFAQVNMPPNFSLEYLADGVLLTSDGSVDVADLDQQTAVLIRPSLATTRVVIVAQAVVLEDARLELFNMHGQLVRSVNWREGNDQHELQIADLPNGMYTLKLSAFPSWKGKFVKQH